MHYTCNNDSLAIHASSCSNSSSLQLSYSYHIALENLYMKSSTSNIAMYFQSHDLKTEMKVLYWIIVHKPKYA